ncbi:MAG TPA: hypothetical protein VJN93_13605 [Candidatus Acidoferrum sp.]|nr:hypothetical protein [Candidatus Acidoferrum sp.]
MAATTVKAPRTIPQDLQQKIIELAVLRSQVFSYARAYERLSSEIAAQMAESVTVVKVRS